MENDLTTVATVDHPQVGSLRMVRNIKTRKVWIEKPDGSKLPIKAAERDEILDNWRRHGGGEDVYKATD